jgi:hypothetical protein
VAASGAGGAGVAAAERSGRGGCRRWQQLPEG